MFPLFRCISPIIQPAMPGESIEEIIKILLIILLVDRWTVAAKLATMHHWHADVLGSKNRSGNPYRICSNC
jgi:hypothetical protein